MSEQTRQNDLYSNTVTILDKYECLSLGATTIGNLIVEKRFSCKKVKASIKIKGKKPDVLIVDNSKRIVAYIECKTPNEFSDEQFDTPLVKFVAQRTLPHRKSASFV